MERDDCALWWWREERDRREEWRESDREDAGESECVDVDEEGTLCRGGGGGRESVGGEGLCRTDCVRLCWAWDNERGIGEDTGARRVEAGWGVVCCWVWEEVEEEEEGRLSRELRPPEVGSVAPN